MNLHLSRLSNGLAVITKNMPNIESLSLGIWIRSGSRHETKAQHGIAHLLEHMAFKGTKQRSAFQIATEIENVGGDINAATSVETTSYYLRLLGKDLALGIDILADILQNSVIDESELEREKNVVLQEIGSAFDTPDDIIFEYFTQTAFQNQEIGRPILGTKETIRSFTTDDIRTFLKDQYNPEDILIIATGNIDHEQCLALVEKKLGTFHHQGKKDSLAPARYNGGDYREKRDLMDTHILLGFEGCPYQSENFYKAQLLSIILGGTMSSRLFQEVREKRGLCYSIYSFHWGFSDTGLFGIHAAANPTELNLLIKVIVGELFKIIAEIKPEEVARAVAQYRAGIIMSKETPDGLAQTIARQYTLTKRVRSFEDIFVELENYSAKDLQIVAKKIFLEKPPTFTSVGAVEHLMSYGELLKELAP